MEYYLLVNEDMEQIAQKEIKELLRVDSEISKNVLEFSADPKRLFQSARRLLVKIGQFRNDEIELPSNFPWEKYLTSETSFKIEVENVEGQENRLDLARKLGGQIYSILEKNNLKPKLELKKPEILVVVYFNGENYFIGIDNNVEELNSREYRVFPHSASFKGDLGYFFVRKSGFKKGKLLSGYCKDGVIAIEAALFSKEKVYCFDESSQNTNATRKNAQLAGVKDLVDIKKISLDELDVKFSEQEFNTVIFQITTKDERKLNEIYYQASYILKSKGKLLFIGRENWEISISDKFKLISEEDVHRGESVYKIWLLEKK